MAGSVLAGRTLGGVRLQRLRSQRSAGAAICLAFGGTDVRTRDRQCFVSRWHGAAMAGGWQRAVLHLGGWHRHGGRCEHRRHNLRRRAPCALSDSPLTRRLGGRLRRISFSDRDACRARHVSSVHDLVEPPGWPSCPTWILSGSLFHFLMDPHSQSRNVMRNRPTRPLPSRNGWMVWWTMFNVRLRDT